MTTVPTQKGLDAICLPDALYLATRLASCKPAGILSRQEILEGDYEGIELCQPNGVDGSVVVVAEVLLHGYREGVKYLNGRAAVDALQDVISSGQAAEFVDVPGLVYFHRLKIKEYYGAAGEPPMGTDTAVLSADGVAKAVWTAASINKLPDSAFLMVESGGKKDKDGKTTPRSLRHFPYKDDAGKVDLPHLRNAIAQIPKAVIDGFDETKQKALQDKARAILKKEEAKVSKTRVDVASIPTPLLHAAFSALERKFDSGDTEQTFDEMREQGREIFGELQKRIPHLSADSPLLLQSEPEPARPSRSVTIVQKAKQDGSDWMYVLSMVLQPNDGKNGVDLNPDYDGEIYDSTLIRKLAWPYVHKYRGLGIMHKGEKVADDTARVVQSYVVDDGFKLIDDTGKEWGPGTWFLGAEVKRSSDLGKKIESGEIGAWSIDGLAVKVPEKVAA